MLVHPLAFVTLSLWASFTIAFTPYIPKCKYDEAFTKSDKLLTGALQESTFVFTGKVISNVNLNKDHISFKVEVKRCFKCNGSVKTGSEVTVIKKLEEGEGILCRQVVRKRFTAIFIGDDAFAHQKADVQLSISPVSVTLANLDKVSAVTKEFQFAGKKFDLTHKPVPSIIIEPCEKTFCAWGGQCVTVADGRAQCVCLTTCRKETAPVCGSDAITYANHCELRVASCKARVNTYVKFTGTCEQNDPCRDKICPNGGKCVVLPDGRNASCVCPDKCPNYGDHTTSRPVCGTDGHTYNNQCELQKASCTLNVNITVKFNGKCDPCAGVKCTEPEICQLDEHRNPICRCGDTCPLEFTPVCGSDGKTYSNECSLRQEACRRRKPLNIIYRGKCSSGINPCISVKCSLGEECSINKFGIAHCECSPACEPIMRPVCTKDGRTFPSECEMQKTSCNSRVPMEIAYHGVCGERGPCSDDHCHFGATCIVKNGNAYCECPNCPAEFAPVCGSDGISYGNECKLKLEACKHRRDIRVLYESPCNGCENKKCDFYSTCSGDGTVEGKCSCPKTCTDSKFLNGTVCGTDGVTYGSECELRLASCKLQQYVVVAYKGNCDLCENVKCKYGARCDAGNCVCPTNCEGSGVEPVCASNMMTFPNECELQKAMCLQATLSPPLTVVFYGDCRERFPVDGLSNTTSLVLPTNTVESTELTPLPNVTPAEKEACRDIHCDFEATCELGEGNYPRCTCQFDCGAAELATSKPVCASDLRIYSSLCEMKKEACQRQEELRLRPLDLCQGMEVKPCRGEKPLTDPLTGNELDCGNGPNRKDCPTGSYCHHSVRISRCCPKDKNMPEETKCESTWFGCCPDGVTPAQGPNNAGCPSLCGCNKLGSFSESCDPETQKCRCRPGVGGDKCDRCEPGYWGLPKISSGHRGCIPCGCSTFGSVREDCEQMTGRCVCKPGVQGQKCTLCTSHEKVLGPIGCVTVDQARTIYSSCKDQVCYFGGVCAERRGTATCECNIECPKEDTDQSVCGSDGQTYSSICHLRQVACRLQKDIVLQAFGACKDNLHASTDGPLHHYTPLQFTQPDETNSLSKSTRHLLAPDPRYYYERTGSYMRPAQAVSHPAETHYVQTKINSPDSPGSNNVYNVKAYRPTPATVQVITALLGDICSVNSDCMIVNSHCLEEACVCLPGFEASSSRQECLANDEFRSCTSAPCLNGGTCVDLPGATFACVCHANFTGQICDILSNYKHYETPAFNGHSYIKLKTLKAYYKLSVEIEFRAFTNDGVLLYNQQNLDGNGDFISLAILDGFVEFKYDLGNGPAIIRTVTRIELGKFHRVTVKRYHRDGLLKLDEGEDVAGQSMGTLKALDLLDDTYIGAVPTNYTQIFNNIGTSKGFQGCIRKLKINRHLVHLHLSRDDKVIDVRNVYDCNDKPCSSQPCVNNGECSNDDFNLYKCQCDKSLFTGDFCEKIINPCMSNPCYHGSTCLESHTGSFLCQCPPDKTGAFCDQDVSEIIIPEFTGTSFIQMPQMEDVKSKFSFEIHFLASALNGLLLYSGQNKNGIGDFICLNLLHGHLQFRFNLGSGIANLTTKEPLELDRWHKVLISRDGREGTLQVNNLTSEVGFSGVPMTELNLDLPFYIGAVPAWKKIQRLSGTLKGFKGAIQKVIFNERLLPINQNLFDCFQASNDTSCSANVQIYDGLPCPRNKNPCLNDGICIPNLETFKCKCHSKYKGKYCQITQHKNTPLKFTGNTHLQYRTGQYRSEGVVTNTNDYDVDALIEDYNVFNEEYANRTEDYEYEETVLSDFETEGWRRPEKWNRYEIRLRTTDSDGLILWRSKNRNNLQNYLSIALTNGFIELSYSLGKDNPFFAIRSTISVNDGLWHTIHVQRRKRLGIVTIDNNPSVRGILKKHNGAIILHTNSKLWIGGSSSLPAGLPTAYYKGFTGCVQHVLINNKPLDLLANSNVAVKHHFCQDNEI